MTAILAFMLGAIVGYFIAALMVVGDDREEP